MIFIYKNIIRSIKGHPLKNLMILFNIILCTMTVFVLLQNYYFLKNHFDEVYSNSQTASHYSIRLRDADEQALLSDCINGSPMYFVGKGVENEINNNHNMLLYSTNNVQIPLKYFVNNHKISEYSYFDKDTFESFYSVGQEDECYFINYMIVSYNINKVFNLKLLKGRFFDKEDAHNNDSSIPIPVVLGNSYASTYDIGDLIEINIEGKKDKAVVIGIMEEKMFISNWGTVEYLDNWILSTCDSFPRDIENNTSGESMLEPLVFENLYCDDPTMDVQKAINRITAKNGYYTFELQPIDGVEISETKNISSKNVVLIGILAFISCVICTCSLGSILYNRSIQDRAVYCIYLCCGIPFWKINLSITIEMLFYLTVSFFPTYALSLIEYDELMVSPWQLAVFSGLIILAVLIPVFKINENNNLDLLIRDKII